MKLSKLSFVIIGIIQFLVSLICFRNNSENVLLLNLFIYWIVSILFAYQKKQNAIVYLFFLVTFFVFLMGQDVILKIFNYVTETDSLYEFSKGVMSHIYFSMHISLFFISLGVIYKFPSINYITFRISEHKRLLLTDTFLKVFKVTIIFKYILNGIAAFNTIVFGYAVLDDGRIEGAYLLVKAAQIADISFVSFLLLAPCKEKLSKPLKLYLGASALSLLGGARGDLMYDLVFVFAYLLFRDYISKRNHQWSDVIISKKAMTAILIASPFFLIFLGLFASIRTNNAVESSGFIGGLLGFFIQQGGSYSLIGYVEELKGSLPSTNISYTFGPLLERIEPFRSNYLQLDALTYDAYYGNNLGSTITCMVNSNYYYSGGGFGTQYIAEIYADFGYWGIGIFSFILGVLFSKAVFFNAKNWIIMVLLATTIPHILAMPRSFYMTFVSALLSVWNIAFLLIINKYVNKKLKRYR